MKNKILKLAKSVVWFVLCLLVGALIFEGVRLLANTNEPAKKIGMSVFTEEGHDYLVVDTKHGICVVHAESCPCHKNKQRMKRIKSIFSMFAYWDRVHQFPDGHIKVENNLAWRRKHMHFRSSNKKIPFQRMKKETRNVVVLDWEDKIKLQQSIRNLEEVAEAYQRPCKELTGINNTLYYLKTIEEEINQRMSLKKK